jgi:hypothetical protein
MELKMIVQALSGEAVVTPTQVIITTPGAGSIDFAADSRFTTFNPANNKIEIIAAGGDGAISTGNGNGVKGGGGGQYAITNNFDPAGGTIDYQIGTRGGSVGTSSSPAAADSWFDDAALTLYAQGGVSATNGVTGGGVNGGQALAVGTSTVHNGGKGGGNGVATGGSGGGGAGGPNGAGTNGAGGSNNFHGTAGGAADGGLVAGGAGSTTGAGSPGMTEDLWATGKGPGSGGGGGIGGFDSGGLPASNGGSGGNYGGGAGAAGDGGGTSRAQGASGILVITWFL